jgi:hypothetical protein
MKSSLLIVLIFVWTENSRSLLLLSRYCSLRGSYTSPICTKSLDKTLGEDLAVNLSLLDGVSIRPRQPLLFQPSDNYLSEKELQMDLTSSMCSLNKVKLH